MKDEGFWLELSGRMGPPIFSATLVGCLLEGKFNPAHLALLACGTGLIAFHHWWTHRTNE